MMIELCMACITIKLFFSNIHRFGPTSGWTKEKVHHGRHQDGHDGARGRHSLHSIPGICRHKGLGRQLSLWSCSIARPQRCCSTDSTKCKAKQRNIKIETPSTEIVSRSFNQQTGAKEKILGNFHLIINAVILFLKCILNF